MSPRLIKPKPPTVSKLKKEADRVFSIFIRLKYADDNGYVSCYTCGARKHYKEIQCGHFISRQHLSLRYDERNCRPQDLGCNVFGRGRIAEFGAKLEKETPGIIVQLFKESQILTHNFDYKSIIEKYGKPEHLLHKV